MVAYKQTVRSPVTERVTEALEWRVGRLVWT